MTRRQRWIKNQKRKPHPRSPDFKTSHLGLVLGVEGRGGMNSGFSAEKRWALSVTREARKPK